MARAQREISISEFFAKNRHPLGSDNPRKALLTCIKEAVDNSLDACEEPATVLTPYDVDNRHLELPEVSNPVLTPNRSRTPVSPDVVTR